MFWKRLLCSGNDCRVLKKTVVCCERLVCSKEDCCVYRKEIDLCFAPVGHRRLLHHIFIE